MPEDKLLCFESFINKTVLLHGYWVGPSHRDRLLINAGLFRWFVFVFLFLFLFSHEVDRQNNNSVPGIFKVKTVVRRRDFSRFLKNCRYYVSIEVFLSRRKFDSFVDYLFFYLRLISDRFSA